MIEAIATAIRIDWCHDTDSSDRPRSYSANTWPFWAIVWEGDSGWRWQHLPHPGEQSGSQPCADRLSGMEAAQAWLDAQIARLTGAGEKIDGGWPLDTLAEPAPTEKRR